MNWENYKFSERNLKRVWYPGEMARIQHKPDVTKTWNQTRSNLQHREHYKAQ